MAPLAEYPVWSDDLLWRTGKMVGQSEGITCSRRRQCPQPDPNHDSLPPRYWVGWEAHRLRWRFAGEASITTARGLLVGVKRRAAERVGSAGQSLLWRCTAMRLG